MSTLLVFDFDWSLIEENSDTFVIEKLGAREIYKQGKEAGLPWTQLMDHVLLEAAQRLGRTRADVVAALHATPLHPALAELLQAVAEGGWEPDADIVVLSDANTVYIDTILARHGLSSLVAEVHTNPAQWRDGALRVAPYHSEPHGCTRRCPANLCKGKVLLEMLDRRRAAGRQYSRVLYVGDGRGDYCPAMLLLHGGATTANTAAAAKQEAAAGGSAGGPAAAGEATTKTPGGAADAAAAAGAALGHGPHGHLPCGSTHNRVFAREEYPDGVPCSLWVMLQAGAGGNSGSASNAGSGSSDHPKACSGSSGGRAVKRTTAAAGGGDATGANAGEDGLESRTTDGVSSRSGQARVVPWKHPQELAELLRRELQLAGGE